MDARPLPSVAEQGCEGRGTLTRSDSGGLPRLAAPPAALLDDLAVGARILGWSEGIHNRTEYLIARNAAIRYLVESRAARVIAAETNFALSRPVDAYIRGAGSDEPAADVVRGVWSWSRPPLRENLRLVRWLRRHNAGLAEAETVRFYGLDMYGSGPDESLDGPAALAGGEGPADEAGDADDVRHARALAHRLDEHRAAGGDHRAIAVRDAAQYASLQEVARRHPDERILLFEQTEHLDRRIPGSLADHIARGELGPARVVGALWRDGDPTVRYPLGPYRELSAWLSAHPSRLLAGPAGTGMIDLRPWRQDRGAAAERPLTGAADAFDAVLYAPALTAADPVR